MSEKIKLRNQHDDVLAYLLEHGSITQLEAYRNFKAPITRLSAIIFDLKRSKKLDGRRIVGQWCETTNCYGKCRFMKYVLTEEI